MKHQILNKLRHYNWPNLVLILLSGFVMSLPFLRIQLGWLSFVSLIPFLYYLVWLENKKTTSKKTIKYIWLTGMVFLAITLSWMFQLHVIDLIADPWTRGIFLPFTLFLMVLFLSSGFVLFGFLYTKLKVSLNKTSSIVLIPAIWILGEYLRSILFSIATLGEGGTVGIHWNFGALGLGACMTPLIYSSRVMGLFGLSFLVVVINIAIFQLARRKYIVMTLISLAFCAILSILGYVIYQNIPTSSHKVGIVHIGPQEDTDYEMQILPKLDHEQKVDLVIMPEYSHIFDEERLVDVDRAMIAKMVQGPESRIITTRSVVDGNRATNAIVELTPDNKELSKQGKTFLIPGGEYIPYLYKGILIASGNTALITHHEGEKTVYQSKKPIEPLDIHGAKYGVLACSGIIAPEFYRDLVNKGAVVLVNSASLSTMGMGREFFDQAYQMARFQAVANSRTLIQSARGKKSYIMNSNGFIELQNKTEDTDYLIGTISANTSKTIYTLWGEWVVLISILGVSIYIIYGKGLFKKKNNL